MNTFKVGDNVTIRGSSYPFELVGVEGRGWGLFRRVHPETGELESGLPLKMFIGDGGVDNGIAKMGVA